MEILKIKLMAGCFMSKDKVNKFFKIINSYNDFQYILSIIICNSGPTLKKQKTASIIIFNGYSPIKLINERVYL